MEKSGGSKADENGGKRRKRKRGEAEISKGEKRR